MKKSICWALLGVLWDLPRQWVTNESFCIGVKTFSQKEYLFPLSCLGFHGMFQDIGSLSWIPLEQEQTLICSSWFALKLCCRVLLYLKMRKCTDSDFELKLLLCSMLAEERAEPLSCSLVCACSHQCLQQDDSDVVAKDGVLAASRTCSHHWQCPHRHRACHSSGAGSAEPWRAFHKQQEPGTRPQHFLCVQAKWRSSVAIVHRAQEHTSLFSCGAAANIGHLWVFLYTTFFCVHWFIL